MGLRKWLTCKTTSGYHAMKSTSIECIYIYTYVIGARPILGRVLSCHFWTLFMRHVHFTCVCSATLRMLSWSGVVGGDVNVREDVLTGHCYATSLYSCLLLCMLSGVGVRWLRLCMLPDWSHAMLSCMFVSFILWCVNCHLFVSFFESQALPMSILRDHRLCLWLQCRADDVQKKSSFGQFQNPNFHS